MDLNQLLVPANIVSLLMLTFMEIVLGIDNIIFVSIVAAKLPKAQQKRASNIGLLLAMLIRIALLFAIKWIVSMNHNVIDLQFINDFTNSLGIGNILEEKHDGHIMPPGLSFRDIILLAGGLFLIWKSVSEMHEKLHHGSEQETATKKTVTQSFSQVLMQIVLLNLVFSFDSILTAIGLVDPSLILVMIISVILSMIAMMLFAAPVGEFIDKRPTIKMLALSFLVLIGVMLVAEGLGKEIEKGYVYFAIIYAFGVELLNLRVRKKSQPIHLHERYTEEDLKKMEEMNR